MSLFGRFDRLNDHLNPELVERASFKNLNRPHFKLDGIASFVIAHIVEDLVENIVLDEHEVLAAINEGIHAVAVQVAIIAAKVGYTVQYQFLKCLHILGFAVLASQNDMMHKG